MAGIVQIMRKALLKCCLTDSVDLVLNDNSKFIRQHFFYISDLIFDEKL